MAGGPHDWRRAVGRWSPVRQDVQHRGVPGQCTPPYLALLGLMASSCQVPYLASLRPLASVRPITINLMANNEAFMTGLIKHENDWPEVSTEASHGRGHTEARTRP